MFVNAKDYFQKKVERMSDKTLLSVLNGKNNKKYLHDWRNWGDNVKKQIAEEAYKRGLIT